MILSIMALADAARAGEVLFQDDFKGKLGQGWSWVREHREAWRVTENGLEVRIDPGNMWGPENNARNVLVRAAPDAAGSEIEVSVGVENTPTNQYEQADLVWYYDDSNMVKLGQELVGGRLSVVMGREEADKARTVNIIPLAATNVTLRLLVKGNSIRGQFRTPGAADWREVGQCDPPTLKDAKGKISLQFYQGSADTEHWARITRFSISRTQ